MVFKKSPVSARSLGLIPDLEDPLYCELGLLTPTTANNAPGLTFYKCPKLKWRPHGEADKDLFTAKNRQKKKKIEGGSGPRRDTA